MSLLRDFNLTGQGFGFGAPAPRFRKARCSSDTPIVSKGRPPQARSPDASYKGAPIHAGSHDARREPARHHPQRSRGRTWKPGDWELTQTLPNLMDEAKRAQADFLRAQTALMLNQSGQAEVEPGQGIDNGLRSALRDFLSKAAETGELPEITLELQEQFRRFGL